MLFKYVIELQYELDGPLQEVWEFSQETETWLKCNEGLESYFYEGELKEGTVIKAKTQRKAYFNIHMIEFVPYQSYKTYIKVPFFSQEHLAIFQAKTENTTIITSSTVIRSPVPFMRNYFKRRLENYYLKHSELFKKLHEELL